MQIILNQSEVEAAVQAYVDDQINLAGDVSIVINADGTASVGINEEVSHNDDTPPLVEKKTRRSRKNPQEAKHRPVEPEPEEVVEETLFISPFQVPPSPSKVTSKGERERVSLYSSFP